VTAVTARSAPSAASPPSTLVPMLGCTFCSIVEGESPAHVVHSDEHAVAFMDLLPMTPGHCLVVPRRHVADIWSLDDTVAGQVMRTAAAVARRIRDRLGAPGLNLLNNNGRAADQSQFHFHIHVIPRYGNDQLLHPWERRFGNPAHIAAVAQVLRGEVDLGPADGPAGS
jgi:histidine triad (HIT) family protein